MTLNIKKFVPALLFSTGLCNAQYTDEINTNRPGMSMSAFAVGKTVLQMETGINGIREEHKVLNYKSNGIGLDLALRYGAFYEELEFIVDMQYRADQYTDALYTYNRSNFSRFTFGAKYLIYDPDKNYKPKIDVISWKANHKFKWHSIIPAVAVYGGINFMGKNNPYSFPTDGISPKLMAITQNHFGKWVWVNNFIFDKFTTDYSSIGWVTTFTRGFNEHWSGFLEFQAYKSDFYADGVARVGAAYLLSPTMQLDASVSSNFKDTPTVLYGGVGFSWRFDADYNDLLLPGSGDRENLLDEDKKKQESDREKKKKEREERRNNLETPGEEPKND